MKILELDQTLESDSSSIRFCYYINNLLSLEHGRMEKIKKAVKMGDFFNSFQMLRFQKQTEYRTFTGGIISIGIIITIVIAFASMIGDTINRTTIDYTLNSQRYSDPPLTVVTTSAQGKFMFGVEVWGYNLSSQNRYFDVVFEQIESNFGLNYTYTSYKMETCTPEHWKILPEVAGKFDTLRVGNWLCPSVGTIIDLQGKYTSAEYHQMSVSLYQCSNTTDPNRPCAPQEEIDAYLAAGGQQNYFTFYYVNSVVNADQPQFTSYFLQDRTFIMFGSQMGAELDLYLKQTDIHSDNSIWPFQDIVQDVLYSINFSPILYPFTVDSSNLLAQFFLMKDPAQEMYERKVQKIFVVFSFMGGLIGAIMACLFIINSYTSFAFEMALSLEVFKAVEGSQKKEKNLQPFSLNIFHFLKYHAYYWLRLITEKISSPFYDHLNECRQEILEQIDIKNIIKRVIFLEYCTSFLLEDYQLTQLQQEKPSLPGEVRKLRRKIQSEMRIAMNDELESDNSSFKKTQNTPQQKSPQSRSPVKRISKKLSLSVPQFREAKKKADAMQDCIKETEDYVIYDEGLSNIRKKMENIRKLQNAAQKGCNVSRKLLSIISLDKEQQSAVSIASKINFKMEV